MALSEAELDDSLELDDDLAYLDQPSDEDTEDASETEVVKREEEFTEIKEQMYQDKLAQLKKQLQQLKEGTLPEYMKKLKKIEQQYKERLRVNQIWYEYELDCVEKDYMQEKKLAVKDFEERKIDLKENLVLELEDKKKSIENERITMELTGDSMEVKTITTRKLRRRPNDPTPVPEKRRKPSPAQLNYCLEEDEIMEDLKIINKVSGKPLQKKMQALPTNLTGSEYLYDARIDEGRLYYDKRWFHRSQPVFIESKEAGKIAATISAVGTSEIWLRRLSDNGKVRVHLSQLQKGRYILRRRST